MTKMWFAIPALAAAAAACDSTSEPVFCPAIVLPTLIVTAVDSVTSANVTPGATLVLRDSLNAVADSVTAPTEPAVTSMHVGQGNIGTFSLTVRKAGYKPFSKASIKVKEASCGPETVTVTAKLQPAS